MSDWRSITNDREKYAAYLCSREWSVLKSAVQKRARGRCERCKINQIDAVHHLTYARKYREELDDLQAICNRCHMFVHGKSDFDQKSMAYFSIDKCWWCKCSADDREWLSGSFLPVDVLLRKAAALRVHQLAVRLMRTRLDVAEEARLLERLVIARRIAQGITLEATYGR